MNRLCARIWGGSELILSQFAGEPTLDEAANIYLHHFYKDGVMLEARANYGSEPYIKWSDVFAQLLACARTNNKKEGSSYG